ncbi:hypothetical protein Dalk_1300 [Desulfatibacillum aliphaticivorans]|uniref:Uncharacterized protein n=2 Tax=Desulfatibacillum TaxID=218207 RepID=B8F9Q7_DESAL|nr:hypothetical protein Dalk_1300 [Desulfatibacillum aliphaticivorans]SHK67405.1 hypothetical protein SAMN02745216_03877 [Desulfatibacillum alkenivorans DSM 16219]
MKFTRGPPQDYCSLQPDKITRKGDAKIRSASVALYSACTRYRRSLSQPFAQTNRKVIKNDKK